MELLLAAAALVLVLLIIAFILWRTRTSLRKLGARTDEAWEGIAAQVTRRAELLPDVVEAVRGHAAHERGVFEEVERARAETLSATDPEAASRAENRMQGALRNLLAVAQAYPELQTSRDFLQKQADLAAAEDEIQASRRFYNGSVRELNTRAKVFPGSLMARGMGLGERQFFEVADRSAISEPPRVQF